MTAQLDLDASYAVRRAGIADVTHVARLIGESAPEVDLDGDGVVDAPADPAVAASVTRLALSHVVLQHGEIWVVDRAGSLDAASVWMPTSAMSQVGDLSGVVSRELDTTTVRAALDLGDPVRRVMAEANAAVAVHLDALAPDVLLTAVAARADLPDAERDRLMVASASQALAELDGVAATMTIEPERVPVLRATGFVEVAEIAVGAGHRLWVGAAR